MIVRVAKSFFVPLREIKYYCSYHSSNAVKRDVAEKRKQGLVVDVTSGRKIATVLYLHTGELIVSNVSIETIHARMKEAFDHTLEFPLKRGKDR